VDVPGAAAGVVPTKLHTHRATVDAENRTQLALLPGEPVLHVAVDTFASAGGGGGGGGEGGGALHAAALRALESVCPAPRELTLKVGAQVLLLKTLDQSAGLVNGARGVVLRLSGAGASRLPTVRFMSGLEVTLGQERYSCEMGGREVASRRQLPLALAWAISIHKSQGQSLDAVEMDLRNTFEVGQAYVALSRARSLGGLVLVSRFEPSCVVSAGARGGGRGCKHAGGRAAEQVSSAHERPGAPPPLLFPKKPEKTPWLTESA
jgi:ATP-dependent DNA helicase PIF1